MPSAKKKKRTNPSQKSESVIKDEKGRLVDTAHRREDYEGALTPEEWEERNRTFQQSQNVEMSPVDGEEGGSTRSVGLGAFGAFSSALDTPEGRRVLLADDVSVSVGENAADRVADAKGTDEALGVAPQQILERQRTKSKMVPSVTSNEPMSVPTEGIPQQQDVPVASYPTVEVVPANASLQFLVQENSFLREVIRQIQEELGKKVIIPDESLQEHTLERAFGDGDDHTMIQVVMLKKRGKNENRHLVLVDDEIVPVKSFKAEVDVDRGIFSFNFVEERSAFDDDDDGEE